jgi:hypothetical protein
MKMPKASEADLKMALDLASMLEGFERGYFPPGDDGEADDFCIDLGSHCQSAMDKILEKLTEGSLFRVVFGMAVLLEPKNKAVDPDKYYIDHHPETIRAREMHDKMVIALKSAHAVIHEGPVRDQIGFVLAKVNDR